MMMLTDISTGAAAAPADRPASRDQVNRAAQDAERGSVRSPIAAQVIARPWRNIPLAPVAKIDAAAPAQPDYPARPRS